jgi:putative MATE family efflux protein
MALSRSETKPIENWRDISTHILRLGWPSIIEQLLIMLVGVFMTMLIGRISETAIAAAGMVNSVFFFVQAVFAALSTGSTVLVARLTGEGSPDVKQAALQSLIMVVISSIAITILCYLFSDPLLKLFLGSGGTEVYQQGVTLFRILLVSMPLLMINIVVSGVFRGVGNMVLPLVVSGAVNIVYLLVGQFMIGSLDMGIAGAAWAAVIARALGCIMIVVAIYLGKGRISLHLSDGFKPDLPMIKRIMNVGLPASVEQLVMQGGFLALNTVVLGMGVLDGAAYPIVMSINSLAFMPAFGLSMASSTLVGHSLGEGDPRKAERYTKQTLFMAVGLLTVISVFLYAFSTDIACWYTTRDNINVISLTSRCVKVLALGEPLLAVLTILAATLRAAGDIKYIMYTSILGIWTLRILLSIFIQNMTGLGVIITMWCILTDFTIRSAMYYSRFRRGRWKTIKI